MTILLAGPNDGNPKKMKLSLQDRLETAFDLRLWHRPHNLVPDISVLEEEQGGGAADSIPRSRLRILVHVHLGDLYPSGVFPGELVQDRREHFTVSTPGGVKFQENQPGKVQDCLLKRPVGYLLGVIGKWRNRRKRGVTFPAAGPFSLALFGNPVLRPALPAGDKDGF